MNTLIDLIFKLVGEGHEHILCLVPSNEVAKEIEKHITRNAECEDMYGVKGGYAILVKYPAGSFTLSLGSPESVELNAFPLAEVTACIAFGTGHSMSSLTNIVIPVMDSTNRSIFIM